MVKQRDPYCLDYCEKMLLHSINYQLTPNLSKQPWYRKGVLFTFKNLRDLLKIFGDRVVPSVTGRATRLCFSLSLSDFAPYYRRFSGNPYPICLVTSKENRIWMFCFDYLIEKLNIVQWSSKTNGIIIGRAWIRGDEFSSNFFLFLSLCLQFILKMKTSIQHFQENITGVADKYNVETAEILANSALVRFRVTCNVFFFNFLLLVQFSSVQFNFLRYC